MMREALAGKITIIGMLFPEKRTSQNWQTSNANPFKCFLFYQINCHPKIVSCIKEFILKLYFRFNPFFCIRIWLYFVFCIWQPHIFPLADAEKCTDCAAVHVIICKTRPSERLMQKEPRGGAISERIICKEVFLLKRNHLAEQVQVDRTWGRIVGSCKLSNCQKHSEESEKGPSKCKMLFVFATVS